MNTSTFYLMAQNLTLMGEVKAVIDLTKNEKQAAYFHAVMEAVAGVSAFRFFAYGGAIRGGKTFVTLFLLILLCKKYPGSRWHVIRKDLPDLKATTIPSFEKLAPLGVTVSKDPGNFNAKFSNGSTIFFKAESISRDPELKSFLGLETNGIFLEQAEELSLTAWEKAKERTGSWYIDPMPPAFIFLTFNPTLEWPRDIFQIPHTEGNLEEPHFYMPALPDDNPFVTEDQWNAWRTMDSRIYSAMVKGDWDALLSSDGAAFYTFKKATNVSNVEFLEGNTAVHLSFDQNVKPYITMLAAQVHYTDNGVLQIRVFKEYCLPHPKNKTHAVCEAFLLDYQNHISDGKIHQVFIYGDASGSKRDTRQSKSDYDIAKATLWQLTNNKSLKVQKSNPEVRKRVLFLCSIFEGKIPGVELLIDENCTELIKDLLHIKEDANGGKLKEKARDKDGATFEKYGHTSDALEYLLTTVLKQQFSKFERIIQ